MTSVVTAGNSGVLVVDPAGLRRAAARAAGQLPLLDGGLTALDRALSLLAGQPLLGAVAAGDCWSQLRPVLLGQRDRVAGVAAQLQQAADQLGALDR